MKMGGLFPVAALILFTALSKGDLPEDDFRIISSKDLLSMDSDVFSDNVTRSFSQLLFDVARDQVIVGARDALLRVSLRALLPLERADWPAPIDKVNLCQDKGQTEEDCHNYVKVLLSFGHKLFACGTNAFSPICSWREIESIKTETEQTEATALCPHNPHSNVTALLSSTGEYYAGTPTNFASSDNAICRSRGASIHNTAMLRTQQYDLSWLNEPQFVGSFEDDKFVYFVFREMAVEFLNCGKAIYSRIARVCKNDSGGHLVMRNNWSTFIKARLSCAVDGEAGVLFYYNEVQSVEYIHGEGLLVAAFTTPGNGIAGSAICIYNMSAIHKAFDGPFKVQDSPASTWEQRIPSDQTKKHFKCEKDERPHQSIEYQRYHLMYNPIEPIIGKPTYKLDLQRFIHLTVDVASTNLGNQLVVYVSTEESDVLKLIVMKNYQNACLAERWRLGKENVNVLTMQFVKETNSVYIGTSRSLLRVSHSHCGVHTTRPACLSAYCDWQRGRCVYTERGFDGHTCYTPVDGGWSPWSSWEPCMQDSPQSLYADDKPDMCMCRRRTCNSPAPSSGGLGCVGASMSVSNCTVHGGWSAWSAWGSCSSSCGIAVKSRRRLCSSPEPKHGGRLCVGEDTQDIYCTNLPPCADEALAPIDGGWSQWSSWSTCTSIGPACGPAAGFKERRRTCNNPPPKNGGLECEGSKSERQTCDLRPCEIRKATAWTPWVHVPGNTSDGSYSEKRFKFLCKAPSPEQLRLTMAREEDRYCTAQGSCSSSPILEEGWGPWGPWGPCSASCEGGQQRRERECITGPCVGANSVMRACNTEPCRGVWSCWSEWSPCSGGCAGAGGAGRRRRARSCLSAEGCAGADVQTALCLNECTDTESGWGEWGEWSECNNNERVRKRSCEAGACVGAQVQVAACDELNNELYALPAYTQNVEVASFVNLSRDCLSIGGIVGVTIAGFAIGTLVTLAAVIYCQRRGRLPWKRQPRVPSSPHYITAKQNSYVTVPLKDVPRKAKRQPSFTGISGSSGILLSKSNNISNPNNQNNTISTPKLYPKAIANEYDSMGTLRRHSNQPRNNFDFEEEKFY